MNEHPYVIRWEGFGPLGADAQKVRPKIGESPAFYETLEFCNIAGIISLASQDANEGNGSVFSR
jgi:hypothetical protein